MTPSRAVRLLAVVLAAAAMIVAVLVSRHTSPASVEHALSKPPPVSSETDLPVLASGPAPSVEQAAGWLNTRPLTATSLAGKVVLYDFWTFACINCQHTLSHLKAWQARYAADGLMIVSIHTPEFDFEAEPANVAEYVSDNDIEYAVALDPSRTIWNTWDNHYWPAFYLYDGRGRLRLRHFGEGSYDTTEDAIRALLEVDPQSPRAAV